MTVIHDSEFRTELNGIKRTRQTDYEAELVAAGIPVKYVYLTDHGWGTIVLANGVGIIAHRPGEDWYPVNKVRNFLCCEAARVKGVEVKDIEGNVSYCRVCVTDTTTGGDLVLDRFLRPEEIVEVINEELKANGEFHYHFPTRRSDIHITGTPEANVSAVKHASNILDEWMSGHKLADADHILSQLRADHSLIPLKVL